MSFSKQEGSHHAQSEGLSKTGELKGLEELAGKRYGLMKIKIKIRDLVRFLTGKDYGEFVAKHNYDSDFILRIQKALRDGDWHIID